MELYEQNSDEKIKVKMVFNSSFMDLQNIRCEDLKDKGNSYIKLLLEDTNKKL